MFAVPTGYVARVTAVAGDMTSNRMPGRDFGLRESAHMVLASVESVARARIALRAGEIGASNAFPRHF